MKSIHIFNWRLQFIINFLYFSSNRFSYGDISAATMFQDMDKIMFGSVLMFIFMQLVLSKFGWVQLRVKRINANKSLTIQFKNSHFAVVTLQHGFSKCWYVIHIGDWCVFSARYFIRTGSHFITISVDGPRHRRYIRDDGVLAEGSK